MCGLRKLSFFAAPPAFTVYPTKRFFFPEKLSWTGALSTGKGAGINHQTSPDHGFDAGELDHFRKRLPGVGFKNHLSGRYESDSDEREQGL
jgi:hypothetical protein